MYIVNHASASTDELSRDLLAFSLSRVMGHHRFAFAWQLLQILPPFLFLFFLESALFPEVLIYSILQFHKDWDKCQIAGDLPSALFDAL